MGLPTSGPPAKQNHPAKFLTPPKLYSCSIQPQSQNINFAHNISQSGRLAWNFLNTLTLQEGNKSFCFHGLSSTTPAEKKGTFSAQQQVRLSLRIAKLSVCGSICCSLSFCEVLWKLQPLWALSGASDFETYRKAQSQSIQPSLTFTWISLCCFRLDHD